MDRTLYVETNLPIGVAKGQDPEAASLLADGPSEVRIVIPGVCFMEAFSVWEAEKKQGNRLKDTLSAQMREVARNAISPRARRLTALLEEAIIESERLLSGVRGRLDDTVDRLASRAEIVDVNSSILSECLKVKYMEDPTDNLILCSVLWHARQSSEPFKAFSSRHNKDFGEPEVVEVLRAAGDRIFPPRRSRTELARFAYQSLSWRSPVPVTTT